MAQTTKKPSAGKTSGTASRGKTTASAQARPGAATRSSTAKTPAKRKRKKKGHGGTVILVLMVLLIVVASAFIYYLGRTIYLSYIGGDDESADIDVNPIVYETTPVSQSSKVGYYLIGLMGEEGNRAPTELLSLACFDKEKKTVRVLQLPQDTYIGGDSHFKVDRVADVFANPKPFTWCDTCRRRVYEPEIGKENTHTVCGKTLTEKEGSATVNLAEVFNYQYALPVDGYYIFEQQTFLKLVDLIGGVDVDLAFDVKVEDTVYKKGVRTIDGAAALKYVMAEDKNIDADIARMARFQQVCVSVLQRLYAMSENKLADDVFQPLMAGSTPIRVAVGDGYEGIVKLVKQLSAVPMENMVAYVIPGSAAKSDGDTYYSVHRSDLLALLSAQFNPYGDPISEGDLSASELSSSGSVDLHETKFSRWVIKQSVPTAAPAETTATTAKQ